MSEIIEGSVFNFTVVAKNRFGSVVPISDASVSLDVGSAGTVTVNPDGSGGVFQSSAGQTGLVNLTPAAAGVTGSPFPLTVTPDLDVVLVELVPTPPVASVEIVPNS